MNNIFDQIIPRRGTNSYKWDTPESPDILPMWVADMDFRTAPAVVEALRKRVEHGIFGYAKLPPAYFEAVSGWFQRRHNWDIRREWILATTGVVPALSAILRALTQPGDKVLVQTPVYNCFFSSIRNLQCVAEDNPLAYRNGKYVIDFHDLEQRAADPAVKLLLLCNPHNPAGRVWTREELEEIARICLKHGVFVVSDEIHCDLTMPGFTHIPFATLSADAALHSATCVSPSKSFNLAGIQIANIIAADETVRQKIDKALNIHEVCDVNAFAADATIAAYTGGESWLDELRHYLLKNYETMKEFFRRFLPRFPVSALEGTYLAWIDCSASGQTGDAVAHKLLEHGLMVNAGGMYGETGRNFIRLNLACPRATLLAGLEKLRETLAD